MKKGEVLACEAALCALYLRGSPFRVLQERRAWPRTAEALLAAQPNVLTLGEALRAGGRFAEAACLTPEAIDWGISIVLARRALTFLDPSYPRGWVGALGSAAPPCVWLRGAVPLAPALAIVGTRSLGAEDAGLVQSCAERAVALGASVVSGGASGTDSVAVGACDPARCVVVLPHGLDSWVGDPLVCAVSACEPHAAFTAGQAMERNALVYSFGRRAVAVRPRLRTGGTWHGALDALRRGLAAVWVAGPLDDPACRALVALGARPLAGPDDVQRALEIPLPLAQPALFGSLAVRESDLGRGYAGA